MSDRISIYREELGNFAFTIEPFSSESRLFRAHFHREDEIGWLPIGYESLQWDEFEVIIKQAWMKLNQFFLEECEQEAWEIYIMQDVRKS
jgi:hypothetical protein